MRDSEGRELEDAMLLWSDVKLAGMSLSNDGRSIALQFHDPFLGPPEAQLACSGVFHLTMQQTGKPGRAGGADAESGLAQVDQVWCDVVEQGEVADLLAWLGYAFNDAQGKPQQPGDAGVFWLRVQGPATVIHIGCCAIRCSL